MAQLWRQVRLAEVCNFQNGFAFKNSDYVEDGNGALEIFRMGNISRGGGFNPDGKKAFVSKKQAKKLERFLLNEGDILMCMTDMKSSMALLGHTAWMPVTGCYLVNQRVGRITVSKPDLLDRRFLYYHSNSPDYVDWLRAHANSGVQVNLSTDAILNSPVPLPPLPIQRRIAGILSAYDELIENSQRRIKILESMARALYREWFVHFRFPGHESVPRVPSPLGEIPHGWEVKAVANSFEISGGGTPSRKDERYWESGTIQWFSPSDLTGAGTMFMDDSSDHITELGLAESSARLFPARSVMLTSRATIGAIAINTQQACTNQGFITCLPNERVPLYFLFHWVTENVPTFQRMASGATFKEISRGVFKTIDFLQPPARDVLQFESTVAPLAEQMLSLQRQIQNLRRTRDLLLPRLLSGQIDVEAIAS
jgi:type I restriction enzyme S subunit